MLLPAAASTSVATAMLLPLLLLLLQAVATHSAGSTVANPHGNLHVEFVQYAVPDSRQANGRYCDSIKIFTWEKRVSACDPQVNLCIGDGDPKVCTVGKIALPWISNSDLVTFGPMIGSTSNPVSLPFASLPASLSLGATIYDHDRVGSPDLIDTLASSVQASQEKKTVQISGRTHLRIRVWFTCAANYYGYLCRMYNHCHAKPCAHGRCVNQPDAYKCHCQAEWTGSNCDERKEETGSDPCAGQTATRFHECRVRYRRGRPEVYAIEHSTNPVADASSGLCRRNRGRRVITGAEAKLLCRG